jgi:hypothetical protein
LSREFSVKTNHHHHHHHATGKNDGNGLNVSERSATLSDISDDWSGDDITEDDMVARENFLESKRFSERRLEIQFADPDKKTVFLQEEQPVEHVPIHSADV